MSIKNLTCDCCLGTLKQISNKHYKCESCDKEYIDYIAQEEELIWLASANQTLRKGNFDDAYEEFANIVSKYPKCFEAYFGMSLCTHGIMYVDDVLENKKVPVCYNISSESILDDINYHNTLKCCPEELKENFIHQATKIDNIRTEWLEKASKEPPYDIFISFKQSDALNNIEKTNDYYSALSLYTYLIKRNYNVFFAPESLKGKISERYEPYIYNALNTSKVMIVYGENPDYFSSTWVKNEWIRFLRKIKNKEKAPESIVVMYKGFNANLLPKELKQLQALDVNQFDYLEVLMDHISKVFESSYSNEKLEKKEIAVGQIATRSRTIGQNQIVKRELGSNSVVIKDASTAKVIESIELLVNNGQFEMALIQIQSIINKEPNNGKLKLLKYLAENKIKGFKEFIYKLENGNNIDFDLLNKLIDSINKEEATKIINVVKSTLIKKANIKKEKPSKLDYSKEESELVNLYKLLLNYQYDGSDEVDKLMLDLSSSSGSYFQLYRLASKTLKEDQIDEYLYYNLQIVKNIIVEEFNVSYLISNVSHSAKSIDALKKIFLQKNLNVDNGDTGTLLEMFKVTHDIKYIESLLSYSKDEQEFKENLEKIINEGIITVKTPIEELLKLIPTRYNDIYIKALDNAYHTFKNELSSNVELQTNYFHKLIFVLEQLINKSGETSERLLDLFTFRLGYINYKDLTSYPERLKQNHEFVLLLPKLDTKIQNDLLEIVNKQEHIIRTKEIEQQQEEERLRKIEEEKQRKLAQEEEEKQRKLAKEEEENRIYSREVRLIITTVIFYIASIVLTILNLVAVNFGGKEGFIGDASEAIMYKIFVFLAPILWISASVIFRSLTDDASIARLFSSLMFFIGMFIITFNVLAGTTLCESQSQPLLYSLMSIVFICLLRKTNNQ